MNGYFIQVKWRLVKDNSENANEKYDCQMANKESKDVSLMVYKYALPNSAS